MGTVWTSYCALLFNRQRAFIGFGGMVSEPAKLEIAQLPGSHCLFGWLSKQLDHRPTQRFPAADQEQATPIGHLQENAANCLNI